MSKWVESLLYTYCRKYSNAVNPLWKDYVNVPSSVSASVVWDVIARCTNDQQFKSL